jgi:hypothetical protein
MNSKNIQQKIISKYFYIWTPLIWIDFSHCFSHHWKGVAMSSLQMVKRAPSKPFLNVSWDSEFSSSADFPLRGAKKSSRVSCLV